MSALTRHRYKFLLFCLLSVADLILTLQLLGHSNGRVYEGNPLASSWLERYGSFGLALYKGLSVLVFVSAVVILSRRAPRTGGRVLIFGCLAVGVVVGYGGYLVANPDKRDPAGVAQVEEYDPSLHQGKGLAPDRDYWRSGGVLPVGKAGQLDELRPLLPPTIGPRANPSAGPQSVMPGDCPSLD